MDTASDATKILEKGPEYLRKQMELESETKVHMSAVERLAASKLKYVKSKEVVSSTQESVITIGSGSVSSTGSSNRSSNRGGNLSTLSISTAATCGSQRISPVQVRRSSSKKRPDSLLIHRQKCELLRGSASGRRYRRSRKLQQKNAPLPEAADKECEGESNTVKITTPEGTEKECSSLTEKKEKIGEAEQHSKGNSASGTKVTAPGGNKSACLLAVPEVVKRSGKGVSRSHSDISSRYSKNFADFDAFFKYCGLEGEVIESLGKENFSARSNEITNTIVRSFSISTSEDGFSRNSGDSDGLLEEELHEKIHQGTSVIERNARIIKWLYSCKNAKETGKKLRDLD
ncbi:protein FAM110C [Notolabrus celidotus]|uniref:protein FAM110C n=1 Tax=Notolabrus celidotus TaxID=1203425 RepID=UPI00148F7403|nr:protein FAM110C [Notolabrus celidotus]